MGQRRRKPNNGATLDLSPWLLSDILAEKDVSMMEVYTVD